MIECNNCYWKGEEHELVLCEYAEETYKGCPNCESDSFLMETIPDYAIRTDDGAIEEWYYYSNAKQYEEALEAFERSGLDHFGYELDFYGEYKLIKSNKNGNKSN